MCYYKIIYQESKMKYMGKKIAVFLILGMILVMGANALFADESNYRSYLYSTKPPEKYVLSKNSTVIIFVMGFDYQWENTIELAIQESLKKQGIKSEILSDYAMLDYSLSDDEIIEDATTVLSSLMLSSKTSFGAEIIGFLEGWSSYEYGGGVAELSASFFIYSFDTPEDALGSIEISTECKGNKMESLRATRIDACESMADSLVEKYLKLITN